MFLKYFSLTGENRVGEEKEVDWGRKGRENQTATAYDAHRKGHLSPAVLLHQRIQHEGAIAGQHKTQIVYPGSGGGGHVMLIHEFSEKDAEYCTCRPE